jgi:hypothetical protein
MSSSLESVYPSSLKAQHAVIHLDYEQDAIPPRQGDGWTRFVLLSDTHCHTFEVPDGDVLLHAGDLTHNGKRNHFKITMDWLCSLPHRKKMCAI